MLAANGRVWGVVLSGVAEWLPHIHDRQTDAPGLLLPEPFVEPIHARLAPIFAAEPDRAAPLQVADHDAIGVTLADRDLIDARACSLFPAA